MLPRFQDKPRKNWMWYFFLGGDREFLHMKFQLPIATHPWNSLAFLVYGSLGIVMFGAGLDEMILWQRVSSSRFLPWKDWQIRKVCTLALVRPCFSFENGFRCGQERHSCIFILPYFHIKTTITTAYTSKPWPTYPTGMLFPIPGLGLENWAVSVSFP